MAGRSGRLSAPRPRSARRCGAAPLSPAGAARRLQLSGRAGARARSGGGRSAGPRGAAAGQGRGERAGARPPAPGGPACVLLCARARRRCGPAAAGPCGPLAFIFCACRFLVHRNKQLQPLAELLKFVPLCILQYPPFFCPLNNEPFAILGKFLFPSLSVSGARERVEILKALLDETRSLGNVTGTDGDVM